MRGRQAVQRSPELPQIYRLLAKAYYGQNEPERAAGALHEYLRLWPEAPDAGEVKKFLVDLEEEITGRGTSDQEP